MQFLLEKLVNREDPGMGIAPRFDLAEAVAAQIQRLVQCRPDVAAGDIRIDDFGMPSIVEFGPGETDAGRFGAWLLRAIARYEPRLHAPRLQWVATGRPLSPWALQVHGHLRGEEEERVFRFELPGAGRPA